MGGSGERWEGMGKDGRGWGKRKGNGEREKGMGKEGINGETGNEWGKRGNRK